MFIGGRRNQGHPPSGGSCKSLKIRDAFIQTWPSCRRAGSSRHGFYKHRPPAGGRARLVTASVNIALLPEGGASRHGFYKHHPPAGGPVFAGTPQIHNAVLKHLGSPIYVNVATAHPKPPGRYAAAED
jgi:hypothetical protein